MEYKELMERYSAFEKLRNKFAKQKAEQLQEILQQLADVGVLVEDSISVGYYINKFYYDNSANKIFADIKEWEN